MSKSDAIEKAWVGVCSKPCCMKVATLESSFPLLHAYDDYGLDPSDPILGK